VPFERFKRNVPEMSRKVEQRTIGRGRDSKFDDGGGGNNWRNGESATRRQVVIGKMIERRENAA